MVGYVIKTTKHLSVNWGIKTHFFVQELDNLLIRD